MPRNRPELENFASDDLRDATLSVRWTHDIHQYRLLERLGDGATAIAWRAVDSLGRFFAIKFVLRSDYGTHSLDAEATRVNSLDSRLFARIAFFGEPSFPGLAIGTSHAYAIAVDWIPGETFRGFLSNPTIEISPALFIRLTRDFCEVLQALRSKQLVHSDLHDRNIIVRPTVDDLSGESTLQLVVIDSGQLKSEDRRIELIEQWQQSLQTLESVNATPTNGVAAEIRRYKRLVDYFSRTDQEWIVCHLCAAYNRMRRSLATYDSSARKFVRDLPARLKLMVDQDPSRRIDDPRQMYDSVESLLQQSSQTQTLTLLSPFDLPSAELIRSDRQLMDLFSEEYPRLDSCRSNAPLYLYGPRGCGKSTILRSLSLKAVLDCKHPAEELDKIPFVGVYISSSTELRSRFLLMREEDFDILEGHVVRYFNLLLIEALVDTLDRVLQWDLASHSPLRFGMSEELTAQCAHRIRSRLGLDAAEARYAGTSEFVVLKQQIRRARDMLWKRILEKQTLPERPDAQLVFDMCRDLEELWPFIITRRLAFLIDDYSNQRIPVALQKKLNQAITFAKQGAPIFKVTSEYNGVDLEGVQEGREVNEVNIGFEYVSLQAGSRYRFLKSVVERRFNYLEKPVDLLTILPLSGLEPAISMAREIRSSLENKKTFHYHGLDTISDLCSGDFAMGLDLIRRIFEQARVNWRAPKEIQPGPQDTAIREYARHEFEYIRYQSRNGKRKYDVADRLCWLSHECLRTKDRDKNGQSVPIIKNHLDIAENALRDLDAHYSDHSELLEELVRRGVLFPLQASRSREKHDATRRLMVRRILLARYSTALGRDMPVRIDDVQRLVFMLTDPGEFVKDELARTAPSVVKQQHERQMTIFSAEDDNDA